MKELAALKVAIDDDGTVLMPVSIDGHDVWMALALNYGIPTLFSAAVDGWNLKARHRDVGAFANGTRIDMIATIKELRVGNANFTGWGMLLIPATIKPTIESFEGNLW